MRRAPLQGSDTSQGQPVGGAPDHPGRFRYYAPLTGACGVATSSLFENELVIPPWLFSGFSLAVPPNFLQEGAGRMAPWRSSEPHHRRRSSFFATIGHIAPSANRLRARGEARGIGLGLVFRGSSRAELDRGREGRRSESDQKHQGQSEHISCRPSFNLFIFVLRPSWIAIMVANNNGAPLWGSSFGGSRAQKPRIVMQFREKLSSVTTGKRRAQQKQQSQGQTQKEKGLTINTSSSFTNQTADICIADAVGEGPSPTSSAASTIGMSPTEPNTRQRSSNNSANVTTKGGDNMIKVSAIHQSPKRPTLGGMLGRRQQKGNDVSSPKFFEAGEYEYELSLQTAPSLGNNQDGALSDEGNLISPLSAGTNQNDIDVQPSSSGLGLVKSLDEVGSAIYYGPASSIANFSPSPPRPPSSCSLSRSKSVELSATTACTPTASAATAAIPFDANLQDSIVVTTRPIPHLPVRKTIYLIRHAESDENRRQQSLYKSISKVRKLTLPTKADLAASLELVDVNAQIDSDVSEVGKRQIAQVGDQLRADDFVVKEGIQLVVHSPLRRARQTSAGMLGCVAPKVSKDAVSVIDEEEAIEQQIEAAAAVSMSCGDGGIRRNGSIGSGLGSLLTPVRPDPTAGGMSVPSVSRIVELPELAERTPLEWLPVNHDAFTNRIAYFEKWLAEQPETTIAVVGHSHYFQCMLGLDYKFCNCDVWRVTYDSSVGLWTCPEEVKQTIRKDYWRQKEEKHRRKSEKVLKELEKKKEKIQKDIEETRDRVKEDWERLLKQMKIDGYKDNDDNLGGDEEEGSSQEHYPLDSKRMNQAAEGAAPSTIESKSVELEKEHLPRGWSGLQRLYTFDPDAF